MSQALKTYTFTHNGAQFVARQYADDNNDPPWMSEDGHGPVRDSHRSAPKRPGETPLGNGWQYDTQAAIELATRDGWGIAAEARAALADKLKREPTRAEEIAESVRFDYERMRAWVHDEWQYVGVSVVRVTAEGDVPDDDYTHAVWGIESDSDYWKECAREIASELI